MGLVVAKPKRYVQLQLHDLESNTTINIEKRCNSNNLHGLSTKQKATQRSSMSGQAGRNNFAPYTDDE